jgi:diguanylate cyclase (GGDEF)-like protein
VLKVVGQRLESALRRANDLVARLGGDEFTVVVFDSNRHPELLEQICNNILSLLSQPIELDSTTHAYIGASIGVSSFPADGQSREQLINAADAAMYAVKRRGKNGFMKAAELPQ